jgi:hypothetical protein
MHRERIVFTGMDAILEFIHVEIFLVFLSTQAFHVTRIVRCDF